MTFSLIHYVPKFYKIHATYNFFIGLDTRYSSPHSGYIENYNSATFRTYGKSVKFELVTVEILAF
jgi:hypothetical protein